VVIAIVDTGIRPDEPDLKDKLVPGYDFVNNDPQPWDDQGHGTLIALVAAAATNNGMGMAGVGYNAQIMPLKALDASGAGTHASLAAAIVWAAEHGADVINLSLGGPFSSRTLAEAVEFAWKRGVVLVAAAGNESSDVTIYPAAYPSVMAVVATTRDMQRASFSNYGRHISIAAPGVGVPFGHEGEIWSWSGTSMATPHVAGVAALVAARNPMLTNAQIRDLLERTAEDLGEPGWDPYFGHGLVNAYRAVTEADPAGDASKLREAMIEAVNAARRERNLPVLRPEPRLMELAQQRAERLAHQCADTVDPDELWACLTRAAAMTNGNNEVALIGVEAVQAAVQLLLNSPTGREMLLGAYWEIGVGLVLSNQNWHPAVWVLRFGQGRAAPVAPPPIGVLSGNKGTGTEAGRMSGKEREPGRSGVDPGDDPYRELGTKQPVETQQPRGAERLIPKHPVTPPAPVPPTSAGTRRDSIIRGP
jgi:lambda repressor-like predicted transcriptional regulator